MRTSLPARPRRHLLAGIVVPTLLACGTHAATLTWNGGDGAWADPTRWTPQQVPGPSDTAVIGGTGTLVVRVDGTRSVSALVLDNPNATLLLQPSSQTGLASLTVANGFVNQGIIELSSEVSGFQSMLTVTSGTLTNAVGGVVRISEGTGGPRLVGANIENRGSFEVGQDLTFTGSFANLGSVHLAAAKSLLVQAPTV